MTTDISPPNESEEIPTVKKSFDLISILVEKVTGTVKWFSVPRHYGFIQRDDNNEDVFVHRNSITASNQRYPTLKSGESVEFSIVETVSGINADSVTGPGGNPVKGYRRYYYRARNALKPPLPEVPSGDSQSVPQQNQLPVNGKPVDGNRNFARRRRRTSNRPPQSSNSEHVTGCEITGDDESRGAVSPSDGAPPPRPYPRRGRGRYMRGGFVPSGPRPFPPREALDQDGYVQEQRRRPGRGRRSFGRGRRPPMTHENPAANTGKNDYRSDLGTELVHEDDYPLEKKMVNLALEDPEGTSSASPALFQDNDIEKHSDKQMSPVQKAATSEDENENP